MEGIANLSYTMLGINPIILQKMLARRLSQNEMRYINNMSERELRARFESLLGTEQLAFLGLSPANTNNMNNIIKIPTSSRLNRLDFAA